MLAHVTGRKEEYTIVEKERLMRIKKAERMWVRGRMEEEKQKEGRYCPQKG